MLSGTTLGTQYVDVLVNDGDIRKLNSLPEGTKNESSSVESRSIDSGVLKQEESKEFSIRLWLDKDVTLSDDTQNKALKAKVVITSEATEIASAPAAVSFAEDSWETIAAAVKSGSYPYQVGDTKTIKLGSHTNDCSTITWNGSYYDCSSSEEPEKEVTIRVSNTSACENGETSETACGFVIEFVDVIEKYIMNPSNSTNSDGTNVGGWRDSKMRTYLNTTIYNALPGDLQNVIADTTVVSGHGSSESTNLTTTDKLYLLSPEEIYIDFAVSNYSAYDKSMGTSKMLDYYKKLGVATVNYSAAVKNYNENAEHWWLRSSDYRYDFRFLGVNFLGALDGYKSPNTNGISPAFRI